jgi:hypothetical protein
MVVQKERAFEWEESGGKDSIRRDAESDVC